MSTILLIAVIPPLLLHLPIQYLLAFQGLVLSSLLAVLHFSSFSCSTISYPALLNITPYLLSSSCCLPPSSLYPSTHLSNHYLSRPNAVPFNILFFTHPTFVAVHPPLTSSANAAFVTFLFYQFTPFFQYFSTHTLSNVSLLATSRQGIVVLIISNQSPLSFAHPSSLLAVKPLTSHSPLC